MTSLGRIRIGSLIALVSLAPLTAVAHTAGETRLAVRPAAGTATLQMALRDLDDRLLLDADGDGIVRAGDVRRQRQAVEALVQRHLVIATPSGGCPFAPVGFRFVDRDEPTVELALAFRCPQSAEISARLTLFHDQDRRHRGLVSFEEGARTLLAVTRPDAETARFDRVERSGSWVTFARFVKEGVVHIFAGLDHVLFLVVLLLPAVLRREGGRFVPAPSLQSAFGEVVRTVTAFTVAHSLTLGLAALGVLRASSDIIEPAIAASVVLAAANNLRPVVGRERWVLAFALGLLHGFGFSSVLADVGLPEGAILAALAGFNLGVELGQLAIVALVVPLAFAVRRTVAYRRLGLGLGSAVAGSIAAVWFIERVLSISLLG